MGLYNDSLPRCLDMARVNEEIQLYLPPSHLSTNKTKEICSHIDT